MPRIVAAAHNSRMATCSAIIANPQQTLTIAAVCRSHRRRYQVTGPVLDFGTCAPCASNSGNPPLISSSKLQHGGVRANSGGARINSGGPRPNSGGYRPGAGGKRPARKPILYLARPDVPHWYCVRTRDVTDAAAEIWSQGFEVFEPTIWRPATRRRRNVVGAMIPARPAGEAPLFRPYIFSRFRLIDFWRLRDKLPSVETILGLAPDAPTPLPDWAIARVRGMCDGSGCYHEGDDTPNSLVGHLLRILGGAFTSFEGKCESSGDGEVEVMLRMFGRDCPVMVDQCDVELV
jgi:transcription antitermination factor NusG